MVLVLSAGSVGAGAATYQPSPLVTALTQKGFKCDSFPTLGGSVCTVPRVRDAATGFSYSQAVALVIPDTVGLVPDQLHLYLQGYRGVCGDTNQTSAASMVVRFHLIEQMVTSGRTQSVIVFPISLGQNQTYNSELLNQIDRLLAWSELLLKPQSAKWSVAGHSGAGILIANSFATNPYFVKKLNHAFLLDATYGMTLHLPQWRQAAAVNPGLKISSVYTAGGTTPAGSEMLRQALPQRVMSRKSSMPAHCLVPSELGQLMYEADQIQRL